MKEQFLPISMQDLSARGWGQLDIILVTGDAYVDHPSYGVAVIGRVLESAGYRVGVIAQPNWRNKKDFLRLGKPRLFFAVTAGNVDSMVANYTANKRPRKTDDYSPGGKPGLRPDRATIVYAHKIRECFKHTPIILGGIEASLKRLAYYDYWDDTVRRSILLDAKADILVYGMAEQAILEIARYLDKGNNHRLPDNIKGTVIVRENYDFLKEAGVVPSFEQVKDNKKQFLEAFKIIYQQQHPYQSKPVVQKHGDKFIIQFPPALPLTTKKLDAIYELPYMRSPHPIYEQTKAAVKAFESIKFSIISHRGCCGECSFCSLYFHQGRIVQSRSPDSIVREAKVIAQQKNFNGTITDVGGPTANLYKATCATWQKQSLCKQKKCLVPEKCKNLELGYQQSLKLYKRIMQIEKVKHVFIGSGFRYDLLTQAYAQEYLLQICKYHISGRMKVAPEHNSDYILGLMNKPSFAVYEKFLQKFNAVNKNFKKPVYLVNYFISAYPGSNLKTALKLSIYFLARHMRPEQVQDFIPLPMTLSACIYYCGIDPVTGKQVYIPRTFKERKMQRALLQCSNPKNKPLVIKALKKVGASHLLKKLTQT